MSPAIPFDHNQIIPNISQKNAKGFHPSPLIKRSHTK